MNDQEIRFLSYDEVLEIHSDQIKRYGGKSGTRDDGLLSSALAQPEAQFDDAYLHDSLSAMAATYLYHLVQNHPFIDGNKRIGAASALAFLSFNGFVINPEVSEYEPGTQRTPYEKQVLRVAQGQMTQDELRTWFEDVMSAR